MERLEIQERLAHLEIKVRQVSVAVSELLVFRDRQEQMEPQVQ
jgi:hypothetical protein